MKTVYKCNYCSISSIDKKIIIKHEKDCSCNPANKKCYSCDHHMPWAQDISNCDISDGELEVTHGLLGTCPNWKAKREE